MTPAELTARLRDVVGEAGLVTDPDQLAGYLTDWRDEDGTSKWEIVHKQGTLHVVRQPAPESVSATLGDRAGAVLESTVKAAAKRGAP